MLSGDKLKFLRIMHEKKSKKLLIFVMFLTDLYAWLKQVRKSYLKKHITHF